MSSNDPSAFTKAIAFPMSTGREVPLEADSRIRIKNTLAFHSLK